MSCDASEAVALHSGAAVILLHTLLTPPKILQGLDLCEQDTEKELMDMTDQQQDKHTITAQYSQRLLKPSVGRYELD